jgi:hypothetical protein
MSAELMMREGYSHNPFDFGAWLRFDAATVTKIKISPEPQSASLPQLTG